MGNRNAKQGFISNYFCSWSILECTFLVLAFVAPVTLGVIFKSSLLQISASSVTMIASLLFAKARIEGFVVSLIGMVLFGMVAFNNRLFGEVGVLILFGLPAQIAGFISWAKALNDKASGTRRPAS